MRPSTPALSPRAGDFAVTVTDSVSRVDAAVTVSEVAVAARSVTLTLSTPVRFGDAVTVSYTPGTRPIQDSAAIRADALVESQRHQQHRRGDGCDAVGIGLLNGEVVVVLSPGFAAGTADYSGVGGLCGDGGDKRDRGRCAGRGGVAR